MLKLSSLASSKRAVMTFLVALLLFTCTASLSSYAGSNEAKGPGDGKETLPGKNPAEWMPPKGPDELSVALIGPIYDKVMADINVYFNSLKVDRILRVENVDDVLVQIAKISKATKKKIKTLIVGGHGDPTPDKLGFGIGESAFGMSRIDFKTLENELLDLISKRGGLQAELCKLHSRIQEDDLPREERDRVEKEIHDKEKKLAFYEKGGFQEKSKQYFKGIQDYHILLSNIDNAYGVMAPGGVIILMTCFTGMPEHLPFARTFGQVLFGDKEGKVIVSEEEINISGVPWPTDSKDNLLLDGLYSVSDLFLRTLMWGGSGFQVNPKPFDVDLQFQHMLVRTDPLPYRPIPKVLPVKIVPSFDIGDSLSNLGMNCEAKGFGNSGKIRYLWDQKCVHEGEGSCLFSLDAAPGTVKQVKVIAEDDLGRRGEDQACVFMRKLKILLDVTAHKVRKGETVSARASVAGGGGEEDLWKWVPSGEIRPLSSNGPDAAFEVHGPSLVTVQLFRHGPFGQLRFLGDAKASLGVEAEGSGEKPGAGGGEPPKDLTQVTVTAPSIWQGSAGEKGFHLKRQEAKGGSLAEMCPYPAVVYGEVSGKFPSSFAPRSPEEIRTRLEEEKATHQKWGRESEIRPFAIGDFQGLLLETRLRYLNGGWSHSGYRDSGVEALGHGWVLKGEKAFEVSYGVGSGGCWNNSQRPFQESQARAAHGEAKAILKVLRMSEKASLLHTPYTGPRLDGTDLPVVKLRPGKIADLKVGEKATVEAVVENADPADAPFTYEWTGANGRAEELLKKVTVDVHPETSGKHTVSVSVNGQRYPLGSATLEYEVTDVEVRRPREAGPPEGAPKNEKGGGDGTSTDRTDRPSGDGQKGSPVVGWGTLTGLWKVNANGYPGGIEFAETGGGWSARLNLHNVWEPLERVAFDPATGRIEFYRPNAGQQYKGTLSEKGIHGTFDQNGAGQYLWEATSTAAGTHPPDQSSTENKKPPTAGDRGTLMGLWKVNANGYPGGIEFAETGGGWSARLNLHNVWEPLERVAFDPATGRIEFYRPNAGQHYKGILSEKGISGTFDQNGAGQYPWETTR